MAIDVLSSTEPAEALAAAGAYLRSRPVEHNLMLTILDARIGDPIPGRYWWATEGGAVVGYAFQSPLDFFAGITPTSRAASDALVDTMTATAPDLPGVIGEAATAAAFAGSWAERAHTPARPAEGQRLYRLGVLVPPRDVPGSLRQATAADRDMLVRWHAGFDADTGATDRHPDPEEAVDRQLAGGRLFVWDDDGAVSMAMTRPPAVGVARVGLVYTPPERRGHGYASACVAALSARVLASDAGTCILYTQLSNPTSNAIYRAIGYEPVAEVVRYHFG